MDGETTASSIFDTRAVTDFERIRTLLRQNKGVAGIAPALDYETFSLCGIQASGIEALEHAIGALDAGEALLVARNADGTYVLKPSLPAGGALAGGGGGTGSAEKTPRSRGVNRRPNTWNSYTTYKSREARHTGGEPLPRNQIRAEYEQWKADPSKNRALVQLSQMSKLGRLPEEFVPIEKIDDVARAMNLEGLVAKSGMQGTGDDDGGNTCCVADA